MPTDSEKSISGQLMAVAVGLAAVALGTAIYFTTGSARDRFVYRITLLLLFFAISTISGLIFTAKASLSGDIRGLSLAVGGPAALWLIALVIFTQFYPESDLDKHITLQGKVREFWEQQQKGGWRDYANWKRDQADYSDLLGRGESETLRNLLWNVDYKAPGQRLDQVEISTVFLYFAPNYTMKFQRIKGLTTTEAFTLNYGAQTSNSSGTAGSVLLVGHKNNSLRVKESYYDGESGPEQRIDEAEVDCLIVSWYDDTVTDDGDYITVDLKHFASDHHGSLRLGVAAFKPMDDIHSWWLAARVVNEDDDFLPLAFREMRQACQHDLGAVEGDLKPWLQLLDRALEPDATQIHTKPLAMLRGAMARARKAAGPAGDQLKPSNLFAASVFKDRRSTSIPKAEDVVLSMFLWEE